MRDLKTVLLEEKKGKTKGGIYHKLQVEMTYNSNHMEGSCLSYEQTRLIYETNTIGVSEEAVLVDDILETAGHFRCIDMVIDSVDEPLTENFIKELHRKLKENTTDAAKEWFAIGDYKKLPNEVAGKETTLPENVAGAVENLLAEYKSVETRNLEEIIDFHYRFERIHPFQDGNGRVGRLIMLKECLRNGIVPFVIDDDLKFYYYRGLNEWENDRAYLRDTCLAAQDKFKAWMKYFRIDE